MITLFTTAKPFVGHTAVIQRNALKSWTLLSSDVEVILFGNDEGAAATAKELNIIHVPQVERAPQGTKYLHSIFDSAQRIARHNILFYCNCDIVLTNDIFYAVHMTSWNVGNRFLIVG